MWYCIQYITAKKLFIYSCINEEYWRIDIVLIPRLYLFSVYSSFIPNVYLGIDRHILLYIYIFNSCIREGYIPTMWKSALISPIPKVHPTQNLQKDLRPISLTPAIIKQLEFFLYKWLIDCVNNKIDPIQFGALKGSSTVHALVLMLHDWYLNTDNSSSKQFIRILLIDYSKAFDRINPLILIDKLKALQGPDVLLNVISSFLRLAWDLGQHSTGSSPWCALISPDDQWSLSKSTYLQVRGWHHDLQRYKRREFERPQSRG